MAPNFGCCTANFVQGWAKFASNVLMESTKDGGVVLALLAPISLEGSNAHSNYSLAVQTEYPFGDNVTLQLQLQGAALPVYIRIPDWATAATLTSSAAATPAPAANGTLHRVLCAPGSTTLTLQLNPTIRVETSWGVAPSLAPAALGYSAAGATIPTSTLKAELQLADSLVSEDDFALSDDPLSDFALSGGASIAQSRLAGASDIRSGGPGQNSSAILNHALYGEGHALDALQLSFRYLCGYSCAGSALMTLPLT